MQLKTLPLAAMLATSIIAAQEATKVRHGRVELTQTTDRSGGKVLRGGYEVWENRATKQGRRITLNLVVLLATGADPRPDPIFWLAGGPGGAATQRAGGLARSWMRRERDIVLVDQRGTGRSNPLHVALPGNDRNLQGYLDPLFQVAPFRAARDRLAKKADLTQYTKPIAADDHDEISAALG